jgi:hypothetical protein
VITRQRSGRALGLFLVGLLLGVVLVGLSSTPVRADVPTPVVSGTPESTSTSTPSPTPLPTWTPVPTSTPVPRPRITPKAEKPRRHTSSKHKPRSRPTSTPTATPTARKPRHKTHHKLHHKARTKAKPTPTPSPTATATPALNLTAEDSVAPVTCNGPKRAVTTHPFLTPPYHAWTSIVSIFDHDSPNFLSDGLTITTTGAQAVPDPAHHRTDFPAYWNSALRQYLDYDGHNGYDYDLYYQPVYAAAAGKVIFAALEYSDAPDHGYGNMVMIDHHNGYVTLYGHFSKLLVRVGQKVRRGQQIGISGNTGHSTGPHLHFTVFHNCSPTDPYGWSGGGPDPLQSYQGESSTYLWDQAPQIVNPLPGWPGLSSLPGVPGARRLLLRLPSTRLGAKVFETSLRKRAVRVSAALRGYGDKAHIDLLRGAVDISAAVPAAALYRLPFVVSIQAPESVDGTKSEVLASLARAELTTAPHREPLAHSRSWTGYLVKLAGRTVLVGSGTKGREVALRLPHGTHLAGTERLHADPRNGLYAVDLGKLSSRQFRAVARALRGAVVTSRDVKKVTVKAAPARPTRSRVKSKRGGAPDLVLPGILLLLLIAGGLAIRRRRPQPEASD